MLTLEQGKDTQKRGYHIYPPENRCSLLVSLIFQKNFIIRANPSTKTCFTWVHFSQNKTLRNRCCSQAPTKAMVFSCACFLNGLFYYQKVLPMYYNSTAFTEKMRICRWKWQVVRQVGGKTPGRTSMQTSKHIQVKND